MSYLLDTGVLLRLVNRHDTDHDLVRNAVRSLIASDQELLIASQNVAEFLNVATRPTANNGLAMSPVQATDLFQREVKSISNIVLEGDATHGEFLRLVGQYGVVGKQVHDARLVAIMLTWQVDRLLTLNDRHFRRYEPEGIIVVTPADLISGSSSPP
jgi:predicted nucleic acid-binding protein